MVQGNRGFPDPDNPSGELSPTNEIIMVTDTDTDDEDNNYNDYEPLPMSDDLVDNRSDDEVDSENEEAGPSCEDALSCVTAEDSLLKEVWGAPAPKAVDIEMDKNKVAEVKQAMLNFTLPASSIPDWANSIPEEEWKEQLIIKLQDMQK